MVESIKYYVSTTDTFDIVVGLGLVIASIGSTVMVVARLLHLF